MKRVKEIDFDKPDFKIKLRIELASQQSRLWRGQVNTEFKKVIRNLIKDMIWLDYNPSKIMEKRK